MLPGFTRDSYHIQSTEHLRFINIMIPRGGDGELLYEPCHIRLPPDNLLQNVSIQTANFTVMTCNNWVYDDSVFKSTFVSKHDLVCDKAHLVPMAMMIFYVGVFVGGIVFGFISDRLGRKKTLFASIMIQVSLNLVLTAANSYVLFNCINFLIGTTVAGTMLTAYVLSVELLDSSTRVAASAVFKGVFAVGSAVLGGVSYLIRDWVYIEFAVAIPLLICFTYYRRVDESVRWLIAEGRIEAAEHILRKAARINGTVIPERECVTNVPANHMEACIPTDSFEINGKERQLGFLDPHQSSHEEGKVWQLFQSCNLSIRTLIVFYTWFVMGLVYYGLTMNTDNLGHDFFLSFALAGLIELPGYVMMIILDKCGLGRKTLLLIFLLLSGITCICAAATALYGIPTATLTLAMIGKLGAAGLSSSLYLYTNEVMPTVVRNSGFGASACFARIGTLAAPYIIAMDNTYPGKVGDSIPLFTFGGVCILNAIVTVFLPETANKELPETIEDAEHIDRRFRK